VRWVAAMLLTGCAASPLTPLLRQDDEQVRTAFVAYGYRTPPAGAAPHLPIGTEVDVVMLACSDGEPGAADPRARAVCSTLTSEEAFALPSAGGTESTFERGARALTCLKATRIAPDPSLERAAAQGTLEAWARDTKRQRPLLVLVRRGGSYVESRSCGEHQLDCFMGPPPGVRTWATLDAMVVSGGRLQPLAPFPMPERVPISIYRRRDDPVFDQVGWLSRSPGAAELEQLWHSLHDAERVAGDELMRQQMVQVDLAVVAWLRRDFPALTELAQHLEQLGSPQDGALDGTRLEMMRAAGSGATLDVRDPCRPDAPITLESW